MKQNDYNVLLLFFNNFDRTKKVFDQIRLARPKNLFLYQDGPRNDNDKEKITLIREYIEKNIDWDCNVYKKYQEKNYGCDPSEYISQTWAFGIVDKCIVLEDDDVPGDSFFEFCWELLIKYEHNPEIGIICGMNNLTDYKPDKDYKYDYFFTSSGCIWGWASWKRVIDNWNPKYSWLDNKEELKTIRKYYKTKADFDNFIDLSKKRRNEGIEYYETILGVSLMLNNQLNIVPCKNLISNIGATGGVHTSNNINSIPKKMRSLYFKKTYQLSFPLNHPSEIAEDKNYKKLVRKQLHLNLFEKIVHKTKRILFRY